MPDITITVQPGPGNTIREHAWLEMASAFEEIGDIGTSCSSEHLPETLVEIRNRIDVIEQRLQRFGEFNGEPQEITVDREQIRKLAEEALDNVHHDLESAISRWRGGDGLTAIERVVTVPLGLVNLIEEITTAERLDEAVEVTA